MNEYITMADGTVVINSYIVPIDNERINVFVNGGHTFQEIVLVFGNEDKTSEMTSNQYGDKNTWTGYTDIVLMQIDTDYAIIGLQKA